MSGCFGISLEDRHYEKMLDRYLAKYDSCYEEESDDYEEDMAREFDEKESI